MKKFIITIDTEGDNLWEYRLGNTITAENARYLPRFQNLCDKYKYKPVYLVNYEMAMDDFFVNFARDTLDKDNCEIGLHLHAWNTPPFYELKNCYTENYGLPYLIEYPVPVMREKFDTMFNLLKKKIGINLVSHRAGRWAMNQDYFNLLIDYGLKIDCSVTPHVSWESSRGLSKGSKGSNYSGSNENPYIIKNSSSDKTITEIPVTIRKLRRFSFDRTKYLNIKPSLYAVKHSILGKTNWLRPTGNNLSDMIALIDYVQKSDDQYLMFMLHSSELMPGGSPSFKTAESIENLYNDLDSIFEKISEHFTGTTLNESMLCPIDR